MFDCCYWGDMTYDRGWDYIQELADYFDFSFIIKREEKNNYLDIIEQSKIMILPYRFMAVRPPLTLVESMTLGKCVFTSYMGGNEELIRHGYTGLMLNFNNIDNIKKAIKIYLLDDAIREQIGYNAKTLINRLYTDNEYEKVFRSYRKS